MHKLGINIDHVATLRQARGEAFPNLLEAAKVCERSGADSIVCHLRHDRRHIQDKDVFELKNNLKVNLNLEMSTIEEIVKFCIKVKPYQATIVPEKRKELTTEGGLDVIRFKAKVSKVVDRLLKNGTYPSLFIDPDISQIDASLDVGSPLIEIHTGAYAQANTRSARLRELKKIKEAVYHANAIGLKVNVGHGLDYENVKDIAKIDGVVEFNIGFSIISRAIFSGLSNAVKEMQRLII